jgi:hypothetical protein
VQKSRCATNKLFISNSPQYIPNLTVTVTAGDCDAAETCTGTSGTCPEDSKKSTSTVCRPARDDCDVAGKRIYLNFTNYSHLHSETCDGGNDCPADIVKEDGKECEDGSDCTETSTCDNGVCKGVDTLCSGICGDGVLAQVIYNTIYKHDLICCRTSNVTKEQTMENMDIAVPKIANLQVAV